MLFGPPLVNGEPPETRLSAFKSFVVPNVIKTLISTISNVKRAFAVEKVSGIGGQDAKVDLLERCSRTKSCP